MDYTSRCQKYTNMSDRDLVYAITINNDEDAAFYLFNHKLRKFFEYLSNNYSKLRYSADDIASEIYILLSNNNWEKLRSFEFRSSLFSWINVVANRYIQDTIKKTSPSIDVIFFSSLITRQGEEDEYDPMENIPDPNQILLEERRDDEDFVQELYKLIDALNPYMKEIIRLRYLVGLSAKKTAEVLCANGKEVTPGAVDQALKRAKDLVRKKLLENIKNIMFSKA